MPRDSVSRYIDHNSHSRRIFGVFPKRIGLNNFELDIGVCILKLIILFKLRFYELLKVTTVLINNIL